MAGSVDGAEVVWFEISVQLCFRAKHLTSFLVKKIKKGKKEWIWQETENREYILLKHKLIMKRQKYLQS